MSGVSKPTILKLLLNVGRACLNWEDEAIYDRHCVEIQADEVWGFCNLKEKNVRPENRGQLGHGSVGTWVAMCAGRKMIVSWLMGYRDGEHARASCMNLLGA